MKKINKEGKTLIAIAGGYLLLLLIITFLLLPYIGDFMNPEVREQFQDWVHGQGVLGVLVLFAVQVLQIVIAFIPGEPIELAAGALYGGWWGFVICIVGCMVSHAITFSISKRFGTPLLTKAFGKEKVEDFAFLRNAKRIETIVFFLFLIPGTPKDMLTYVVGMSPMKLSTFVGISIFARIPSILSSTMMGDNLMEGNLLEAAIIFAVTAVVGLVGIRFKGRMMKNVRRMAGKEKRATGKSKAV